MTKASGLAHITLTVSDIGRSKAFYEQLFGIEFKLDNAYSFSLSKAGIPCWFEQFGDRNRNDRFDEKRIGLNHVAFKIETLETLKFIVKRLDEMNVKNAGLQRFVGKYPYVAFDDPDGIYIEFFIPKDL